MDDLPIRKLSRLGNEMHLTGSRAVLDLTGGQHDRGVVALLLMSRCCADWVVGDAIRRPDVLTQAVSIRAVASSLRAPYASTHRYILALQQQGLVIATPTGFAISNAADHAPGIIRFLAAAHDGLVRLIEDLASDMGFPPPRQPPTPGLRAAIVAIAIDIWLIPFEVAREPVTDWTSKLIWIVIVVANVRHIAVDTELSERYAIDPTPDALRRPLSVRVIAALTGLSYGTVYRHCQALAAQDVIRYDRGGWLLVSRQLSHDDIDQGVRAMLGYYAKRIGELIALGFDTGQVGRFYLEGRPGYVPL